MGTVAGIRAMHLTPSPLLVTTVTAATHIEGAAEVVDTSYKVL